MARPRSLRRVGRPGCALGDPLPQRGDGRLGKLARRRHLQLGVGLRDGLNQQALIRLARHERRPGVAPLERRLAAVEPQARGLLLLAVALEAAVDQDRPDLRLEEFDRFRRKRPTAALAWPLSSPPPRAPATLITRTDATSPTPSTSRWLARASPID